MRSHPRAGRACSRAGCRQIASKTLIYIYAESAAVLSPLATYAEPHAYDLCDFHSARLTLPNGWSVSRIEAADGDLGPNDDDLMAIADAVREVAATSAQQLEASQQIAVVPASATQEIGRRGHLRSVPTDLDRL